MRSTSKLGFRFDINALRAWAVFFVVMFHFGVPGFEGGFAGVDIFFVISGYLMTRIIVTGMKDGSFSLSQFVLARSIRIIPAVLILVLVLLIAGFWLLASRDYTLLAKHATYAVLFWSNMRFWSEAGYFDEASDEKWLLHTWSLSAEWQFYLLLPVLVFLAWKLSASTRSVLVGYVVIALASFGISVWLSRHDEAAAFYGLHSRAWEMLAGGFVYFLGDHQNITKRVRQVMLALGYGLMASSVIWLDEHWSWPGMAALIPITGTVLVLWAGIQQGFLARFMPIQWLGLRSYSIYLWHWPVVVGMGYLSISKSGWTLLAALLLVLILGELSWRFIEEYGRRWLVKLGSRNAAWVLLASVLFVFFLAKVIDRQNGIPSRLPAFIVAIEQEAENINPRREKCHGDAKNDKPHCVYGGSEVKAVVWGDSHASATVTALQAALPSPEWGVLAMTYTSCPSISHVERLKPGSNCHEFNAWALERIKQLHHSIPVVILNRSSSYLFGDSALAGNLSPSIRLSSPAEREKVTLAAIRERMLQTWCPIAAERPLWLVKPIPEMPQDVPDAMARAGMRGKEVVVSLSVTDYMSRHAFILSVLEEAKQCGAHLLDPLPFLCKQGLCLGAVNGQVLYSDDNHLSESGNRLLIPMFQAVFK